MSISTACHCDFRSWGKRVVQIYACVYSFYANGWRSAKITGWDDLFTMSIFTDRSRETSKATKVEESSYPNPPKGTTCNLPHMPTLNLPPRRFLLPFAAEYTGEGSEKEIRPWLIRDCIPLDATCFKEESEGGWMEWIEQRIGDKPCRVVCCDTWYWWRSSCTKKNLLKNPHPELIARPSDTRNQHWTTIDTPRTSACLILGHWESATGVACCLLTAGVSLSLWKTLVALDSVRYRKVVWRFFVSFPKGDSWRLKSEL